MEHAEHRIPFEAWWNGVHVTATLDVWAEQVDLVPMPGAGCLEVELGVFEALLEHARQAAPAARCPPTGEAHARRSVE